MDRKTQATDADVAEFLAAIPDERRRADSEAICRLMADCVRNRSAPAFVKERCRAAASKLTNRSSGGSREGSFCMRRGNVRRSKRTFEAGAV